jgi:hypothetical protein
VKRSATTDHYGFSFGLSADDDRVMLSILYGDESVPEEHRIWFTRENYVRLVVDSVRNLEWTADERTRIVSAASGGFVAPAPRPPLFEGPG